MEKIKIFTDFGHDVEKDYNVWFEDEKKKLYSGESIKITRVLQTPANTSGYITLTVFYEVVKKSTYRDY